MSHSFEDVSRMVQRDSEIIMSACNTSPTYAASPTAAEDGGLFEDCHSLPSPPLRVKDPAPICSPTWRAALSLLHGFVTTALLVAVLSLTLLHVEDEEMIIKEEKHSDVAPLPSSGRALRRLAFGS
eukprot:CAMPEP_0194283286 /NCGR_PEP_ID=MMETSP0169-20130528/25035_1 /TAXON_ID=218684 /ORGANISM="Corethron pennatum, Strain L29A3" /LENGTH=125 /DNA_ID=CAMNT_0039028851 /DNA_START=20 /DNA_END=394 /DNA_ORIENTATION=+